MNLQQINKAFQHRVTGGTEYMWNCYPDGRYIEYGCDLATANVVFDSMDQKIYEATIELKGDKRPYRWVNPSYKQAMEDESDSRGVDKDEAWDDVKWIDLETEEDFLEKATAIFAGEEFDQRIQVPLELSEEEMLQLCMLAHSQDITLNQLVVNILMAAVQKLETKGEKA